MGNLSRYLIKYYEEVILRLDSCFILSSQTKTISDFERIPSSADKLTQIFKDFIV